MKDLDFLPTRYRHDRGGHRRWVWRAGAAILYAGMLAALCGWQIAQRRQLAGDVALASNQYDLMMNHASRCAEMEAQLRIVESEAQLWTYLRHPWPRTQILSALAEPLPTAIIFEELSIHRAEPLTANAPIPSWDRSGDSQEGGQKPEQRPAVQRDLERLRAGSDAAPIVVTIEGATHDIALLHAYLGELRRYRLFSRVELVSAQSREALGRPELHFIARVTVRPGYGQTTRPAGSVAGAPQKFVQRT